MLRRWYHQYDEHEIQRPQIFYATIRIDVEVLLPRVDFASSVVKMPHYGFLSAKTLCQLDCDWLVNRGPGSRLKARRDTTNMTALRPLFANSYNVSCMA